MPRRKLVFVTNEVYHVFNRGVEYRDIFLEKKNYVRFIELLDYYQWTRSIKFSSTQSNTPLPEWNIESAKLIDVNCYCLMPNHFHLVLRQKKENGLSKFLRVIQDSYTRYFNINNNKAIKFAKQHKIPLITNSDAHFKIQLIKNYSILNCENNIDSILESVKKGKFKNHTEPLTTTEFVKISGHIINHAINPFILHKLRKQYSMQGHYD